MMPLQTLGRCIMQCSDLKRKGLGSIQHCLPIEPEDLKKLYEGGYHTFDNDTPVGLQNKVLFKIMYCLCCQRHENLREMRKDTFRITTNWRSSPEFDIVPKKYRDG